MRTRELADGIARWCLILLVGLTPFFIIPAPWATVQASKYILTAIFLCIALLAWLVARYLEGAAHVPRAPALAAAVLLPGAYFLSALASHASAGSYLSGSGNQDTVVGMVLLAAVLVLYALVFGAHDLTLWTRAMLRALFAGAGAVLVVQIVRLAVPSWFGLNGALTGSASSLVGTWHDLGIFLALMVVLTLALWASPQFARGYARGYAISVGVLAFLFLIVIDMQDVWYLLGAAALVFAACQWGSARFHERKSVRDALWRAAVPLGVALIAVALALSAPLVGAHLPGALQIPQTEVRPSWQGTFEVGQKVFSGSGLVFGSGPNTFTENWDRFKPVSVNETQFWSVGFSAGVGLIPTSFISAGILAILAWFALLMLLFLRTASFLKRERLASTRSIPAAFFLASWLLVAFHVFYTPGFALSVLLFVFIGMSFVCDAADMRRELRYFAIHLRTKRRAALVIAIAALSLAVAYACVYAVRAALSDMALAESALEYSQRGDVARSLAGVREALALYPQSDAAHRAAVQLGILQLQQLTTSADQSNAAALQATLSQTIQDGLNAVSINSADYQNWLALAGAWADIGGTGVSGAYANALSAYQKAAAANPTNPLPLIGAAQVAIAEGDASSSLQYLDAAITLKPDLASAYFLRSEVETTRHDLASAEADAKEAVSLAAQDPLGWYNLGVIFYASGQYSAAVQALSQALLLEGDYANALFARSLAFEKLGQHAAALADMQHVVTLNPGEAGAIQALANLEAGKDPLAPPSAKSKKSP